MTSKQDKRKTRDDFEELLKSGATRTLGIESRELDDIGPSRRHRQRSASTGSSAVSGSSGSIDLHPGLYSPADYRVPSSSYETKRRSVFRSTGTGSTPDLATLVRQTKESRTAEAARPAQSASRSTSAASLSALSNGTAGSPRRLSTILPPTPGLGAEPPARIRTQSMSPTPESVPSRMSGTADSFVRVSRDVPSSSASPRRSSQPPPRAQREETAISPSTSSSTLSNTMRKTSGFFRKRIAGMRSNSGSAGSSPSVSPVAERLPPPVPTLPNGFASPPRPTRTNSSDSFGASRRIPGSPDRGSSTPERSASPARKQSGESKASQQTLPSKLSYDRASQWSVDWAGTIAKLESEEMPDLPSKAAETPVSRSRGRGRGTELEPVAASPRIPDAFETVSTPTNEHQWSRSPASDHSATFSPPVPPKEDRTGLGLDTIAEARSREASVALASPERDGSPVLVQTSPSPQQKRNTLSISVSTVTAPPAPADKKRHSVVGYPSARSPATPGSSTSLAMSRNASTGSGKAVDDAISPGTNVEERAAELAKRCWEDDETFLRREKIAEWLGGHRRLNELALTAYMANFDFSAIRLDIAFRRLCDKLYLKAETQQIDRILAAFSRRYWDNNPTALYGSADIVHIVAYTLLLLNTDLHVVDSNSRMSRVQFVRNAMAAISAVTGESSPLALSRTVTPDVSPTAVAAHEELATSALPSRASSDRLGDSLTAKVKRSNSSASQRGAGASPLLISAESLGLPSASNSPAPSPVALSLAKPRKSLWNISGMTLATGSREWQAEMESLLKDMYGSIKDRPVFQPTPLSASASDANALSPNSPYSSFANSRAASRRSQVSFTNLSGASDRSKRTSLKALLGPITLDGQPQRSNSPTPSAATSFSENVSGSTAYGSSMLSPVSTRTASTAPTVGFASNLSHTIIREAHTEDEEGSASGHSLGDEELALLGAPWAKEGNLQRKHYWEAPNRRSKDKEWLQVFVVISKGELKMFRFGQRSKSAGSGGVGGGNWMNNASLVGELNLTHALCTAMPAPGYNKSRPHVFVLTLASGSSYFFEAGTADLVQEWVSTCNYWSARLSSIPLTGGVSNMDYGWNKAIANDPEDDDTEEMGQVDRSEVLSLKSTRSVRSKLGSVANFSLHDRAQSSLGQSVSANPNDRIHINEWRAPAAPQTKTHLSEEQQLEALKDYLSYLAIEADRHGEIRKPMITLYSSRSTNMRKAQDNWVKKQQHLTEETVKFSTYHDALASAIKQKQSKVAERTVNNLLQQADEDDDDAVEAAGRLSPTSFRTTPTTRSAYASPVQSRPTTAVTAYEGRPSVSSTADSYVDAV